MMTMRRNAKLAVAAREINLDGVAATSLFLSVGSIHSDLRPKLNIRSAELNICSLTFLTDGFLFRITFLFRWFYSIWNSSNWN